MYRFYPEIRKFCDARYRWLVKHPSNFSLQLGWDFHFFWLKKSHSVVTNQKKQHSVSSHISGKYCFASFQNLAKSWWRLGGFFVFQWGVLLWHIFGCSRHMVIYCIYSSQSTCSNDCNDFFLDHTFLDCVFYLKLYSFSFCFGASTTIRNSTMARRRWHLPSAVGQPQLAARSCGELRMKVTWATFGQEISPAIFVANPWGWCVNQKSCANVELAATPGGWRQKGLIFLKVGGFSENPWREPFIVFSARVERVDEYWRLFEV